MPDESVPLPSPVVDPTPSEPSPPSAPSEHGLSVKCLDLVQRLNGQIHALTQVLAVGDDASLDRQVCRKTLDQLTAACVAAGI